MTELTIAPDVSRIEIPVDTWTGPFWEGTSRHELLVPRCGSCQRHRWPAGPFCPACQSQEVDWLPAGEGRVYSFTLVPDKSALTDSKPRIAPALIEFPQAGGVRIMAAIVGSPVDAIAIDAPVTVDWRAHGERNIPVFRLSPG